MPSHTHLGQPHVLVLGLGIAGSSVAATLAMRGFRVTAVEQFAPLHERGSSHGDTRIFRRVPHEGDVYVEMAGASMEGWRAWSALAGEPLLIECGGIDAGPEESSMVASAERLCERYGQGFEVMSGGAFNRRHPHFQLPEDWRVIYQAASGVLRPDATRTFLHRLAREHGARLLHETAVLSIEARSGGVLVRTANETLTGDLLVVAGGGWLPQLLPELGLRLSVERRVLVWYEPVRQELNAREWMDGRLPIFCLDADGGWYGMPTLDGRIKIGHDKHLGQRIDPNDGETLPGAADAARLSPCVDKYLKGFEAEPSAMKSCIYTITEDHHFLIDWHPEYGNVLVFSCCSGHGFKYAPVYGEIVADLLECKSRPEFDLFGFARSGLAATRFGY